MDAKQFLKEKGISNNDFMDSGVADLIETLLTEYQALQLQQTGVKQSVCNNCGGKKIKLENGFERCKKCQKLFA
jgi:tRNA(Ile2) C34 agmatinyltransferase TiaS